MKIENGKMYRDKNGVIWKVNGSTNNISCAGVTFHLEKLFKDENNFTHCSLYGIIWDDVQDNHLVSEFTN
jgi:hypothetical protein